MGDVTLRAVVLETWRAQQTPNGSQHTEILPCATLDELHHLSQVHPTDTRIVEVWDGQLLLGMMPWVVGDTQLHGLQVRAYRPLGWNLYDYHHFHCTDITVLGALFATMLDDARAQGADVVLIHRLLDHVPLPRVLAGYIFEEKTTLFDARLAKGGWQWILRRQSIKRHWKKLRAFADYQAVTTEGVLSEDGIAILAGMHQERWGFEDKLSTFSQPDRRCEYACYPKNKIFTKITADHEVVACHFGIRYGDLLLWHTPLINIKYLEYSPLEVLLAETCTFCEGQGIQVLDFGFGNERYKARFVNAERKLKCIEYPLTLKGMLACNAGKLAARIGLKARVSRLRRSLRTVGATMRARLTSVKYYEGTGTPPLQSNSEVNLRELGTYAEYVDFCRTVGSPVKRFQYERYQLGAYAVILVAGTILLSSGWVQRGGEFYISEIDKKVALGDAVMLYDFHTPQAQRNRGYFTRLLRYIRAASPPDTFHIFALTDNIPSNKGIMKAGFTLMTEMKHG
ncbi:MAG: GNAT family N-acetyltransferase [Syntrophobacteraceae bacterium]